MTRILAAALTLFSLVAALPARALDPPQGLILLTVTGSIEATNAGNEARFDRAMLQALDWQVIRTFTPFTEGPQVFAGPTLASLLGAVGVRGGTLTAVALNDYAIEIPVSDAFEYDVVVALDHNGVPMRPRGKGPIWLIYPMDRDGTARRAAISRMVWQLHRLTVAD